MLYKSQKREAATEEFAAMQSRRLLSRVHAIAGTVAFAIIFLFLSASLIAELLGNDASIARVKETIAWSLLVLVPALMATGGSGFAMAGRPRRGPLLAKFNRMRIVAANGMLVLVPAALFLAWKAGHGALDASFVTVQVAEFAAGSVNLVLMGLNIRDGFRMSGRFRAASAKA
jgi:hypothetical protein